MQTWLRQFRRTLKALSVAKPRHARTKTYLAGQAAELLEDRTLLSFSFPTFPNPSPTGQFLHLGSSQWAIDNNVAETNLQLTSGAIAQAGAVWFHEPQSVINGFQTSFSFRLTPVSSDPAGGGSGDGFAFVIQNHASNALGLEGGHLGYATIPNSLAIEFDVFSNRVFSDPPENHVSVHTQGLNPNSASESASLGIGRLRDSSGRNISLLDSQVHTATIHYGAGVLEVSLDGVRRLAVNIDLDETLSLTNGKAFVGFTGGTGNATADQDIASWLFIAGPDIAAIEATTTDFQHISFTYKITGSPAPPFSLRTYLSEDERFDPEVDTPIQDFDVSAAERSIGKHDKTLLLDRRASVSDAKRFVLIVIDPSGEIENDYLENNTAFAIPLVAQSWKINRHGKLATSVGREQAPENSGISQTDISLEYVSKLATRGEPLALRSFQQAGWTDNGGLRLRSSSGKSRSYIMPAAANSLQRLVGLLKADVSEWRNVPITITSAYRVRDSNNSASIASLDDTFSSVNLDSLANASYTNDYLGQVLTDASTIIIKTLANGIFKIGNVKTDDNTVEFDYQPVDGSTPARSAKLDYGDQWVDLGEQWIDLETGRIGSRVINGKVDTAMDFALVKNNTSGKGPFPLQFREFSLHYEGRALDIQVDGRDTDNRVLRHERFSGLAWLAGFDWIYHEKPGAADNRSTDPLTHLSIRRSFDTNSIAAQLNSPANLLAISPGGQRTGVDQYGATVDEIDLSVFSGSGSHPQVLSLLSPASGRYVFHVNGTGDGNYTVNFALSDTGGATLPTTVSGAITAGGVHSYIVEYSGEDVSTSAIRRDAPPVTNQDGGIGFTGSEDEPFLTESVLRNDWDPDDNDSLSVIDTNVTDTVGAATYIGDGTFSYDPSGRFEHLGVGESATDSFTYAVMDEGYLRNTAIVTITITGVNDVPGANDDGGAGFATDEDSSFSTANVLGNDTDADASDILTIQSIDLTGTIGLVTSNGDGTFGYDPNGQFEHLAVGETATDSFVYTVSDGHGGVDTATVTITLTGVNDAPVAGDDGGAGFTTDEDGPFTTANVLDNDTDVDVVSASRSIAYVGNADEDTVSIVSLDTLQTVGTISVGDAPFRMALAPDGSAVYVVNWNSGNVSVIDTASASVIQTIPVGSQPREAVVDPDGTRVFVTNAGSASISVIDTATNMVVDTISTANVPIAIEFHPVRDEIWVATGTFAQQLQVFSGDDYSLLANLSGFGRFYAAGGIAFTPEGNELFGVENCGLCGRFHRLSGNPVGGTISVLQQDILYDNRGAANAAIYNPVTGVAYLAKRGQIGPHRIVEFDGAGRTLTLSASAAQLEISDNGKLLYATLGDGHVAVIDTETFTVIGTVAVGARPEGIVLTEAVLSSGLFIESIDTIGTLGQVVDNGDGTFDYDPGGAFDYLAVGETASDQFAYTVSDGQGGADTAIVTITITGVNDVPVANDDGGAGFATDEDSSFSTANVLGNDTDADASDILTIQSIDLTGTIGLVTSNGDGTFGYDPNGQFEHLAVGETATDSFVYTVSDGHGGVDTATVTITLDGVNDAPQIASIESDAPLESAARVNEAVSLNAVFVDVDITDFHIATIQWGDGLSDFATVTKLGAISTVEGRHVYTSGNVYTVTLTVVDPHGGQDHAATTVFVVGAGVDKDGVLNIVGTNEDDVVLINNQGDRRLAVHANFFEDAPFKVFDVDSISEVRVFLRDGDDHFNGAGNVTTPTIVDGGDGDDHINGGRGNDILLGGAGRDIVIGGRGDDIIVGGFGGDQLIGNHGADLLIGGATVHDADFSALRAILAEWTNADHDYATRVANIRGEDSSPGFNDRLNGDAFLKVEGADATVIDDEALDLLFGGIGMDWLLFSPFDDQIRDRHREELLN